MSRVRDLFESTTFRQHAKTVIVGLAVLVATFSATLLTGWITSRKTPPDAVAGLQINFEIQADFLTAKADSPVRTWQYVGPKRQSTCDESIFDNFLGFGQTFKEGDRVRLDFHRDNNSYYCFKAIAVDGTTGFGFYYVINLPRPVITFEQTKTTLTAGLSNQVDRAAYTDNWQYVLLANKQSACSASAFADPLTVTGGKSVALTISEHDLHYCFRLQAVDGSYTYRLGLVPAGEHAPPVISTFFSGRQIYLLADQEIKTWAVALAPAASCGSGDFADPNLYRQSREQIAIINTDSAAAQLDSYCVRAQNQAGLYSYERLEPSGGQAAITITAALEAGGRLNLTARANMPAGGWQIRRAAALSGCQPENFTDLGLVSSGASHTVGYPTSRYRVYCFRATAGGEFIYGAYRLPAGGNLVGTYRLGDLISGHSIYPQLDNWQYAQRELTDATVGSHCSAADFTLGANVVPQQTVRFSRVEQYCFRAESGGGGGWHYGRWFTANLRLDSTRTDETAAALAAELGLSELGRLILYQTQPSFHDKLSELREICQAAVRAACYLPDENRLHVLEAARNEDDWVELRRNLAQAARLTYLTPDQRAVQIFELSLIYRNNRAYFDTLLPGDFYDDHLYEDELAAELADILISLPEAAVDDAGWRLSWLRWREALFD